jgi:hypothetical protein
MLAVTDETALYVESAAFVAVTTQVTAPVVVSCVPVIEHPEVEVAKLTAPVPDPPELASVTAVP